MRPGVDKYGRGSAAVNGEGFVDLAPGDTFAALEEQLKGRIADRFDNLALGITASIGSKRNASELAKHLAAGEEEEVHKFAAKNIGVLFVRGKLGICHDDKKAVDETRAKPKILRVFSAFEFAGSPLVATITIKPTDDGLRLYAIEALDIMRDERLEVHLAAKPRHFKTTRLLLENRIAYYVGVVNRTHPKFVGQNEQFTIERTVELLQNIMSQTVNNQTSSAKRQTPISFIIPVYKTPLQLLRNCLDSVLKYSQPMELICVLDSPGDPCEAVLDEYAAKEPRMRLLKNDQNRGVSYSRNRGMDAATGGYLAFVDADDEIVAIVYERQCVELTMRGTDAEIMAARRNDEVVEHTRWGVPSGDGFVASVKDGDGLGEKLVNVGWLSAYPIIFRRDSLLSSGARFIEGKRYGEDYVFITQFLCSGVKVGYRNVCGYVSVGHPQSTCQIGVSAKRCIDTVETAALTCELATASGVHKEALRIYLCRGLRMIFCDYDTRQVLQDDEDWNQYRKWLSRFCRVLEQNAPMLSFAIRGVLAAVGRFPALIFWPCAPMQNFVRTIGHFGWLLR